MFPLIALVNLIISYYWSKTELSGSSLPVLVYCIPMEWQFSYACKD